MDGEYVSKINIGILPVQGKMMIKTQDKSTLIGYIEVMGYKSNFQEGQINGNSCYMSGNVMTKIGEIKYQIEGKKIDEKSIMLTIQTNKGTYKAKAIKIN